MRDDALSEQVIEATVKVRLPDGSVRHDVAEGDGPVGALDAALRKALDVAYPTLRELHLVDFKVRVVDGASEGTSASIRVTVESACKQTGDLFSTIGVSTNIIEVRARSRRPRAPRAARGARRARPARRAGGFCGAAGAASRAQTRVRCTCDGAS